MSTAIFLVVYVVYLFLLFRFCNWAVSRVQPWAYSLGWAVVCTAFTVFCLFTGGGFGTAFNALIASFWWRQFWKQKPPRMRDKVKKLVGAKARAIRDKLVASMPKASPVAKPGLVPVGI